MQDQFPDVTIIGVALDGAEPQLLRFIDEGGAGALDHISGDSSRRAANDLANEYEVLSFPAFAILLADGTVETLHQSSAERLAERLSELTTA
jgi:hypothetical protein